MTIILAAKSCDEIVVVYDTIGYYTLFGISMPIYNVRKVQSIDNGNMCIGVSGYVDPDREIAKFNKLIKNSRKPHIEFLTELIEAEMWLSTSKSKDGLSTKNYIVGAVEHSGLHLLVSSSEGYSKVKEAECCGIGCGMYPEVTKLLEEGYSANIDRTRLLILLYRAFDLANILSRERQEDNKILRGCGTARLTQQGYLQDNFIGKS